jgi:HlyD family secretion protein
MRLTGKRVGIAAGALGAVLLAAWALRPEVPALEVARVARAPLVVSVEEDGTTRVRHHAEVVAPVTGRVVPAALDEGDAVAAGAVVARLYPLPLDPRERAQAEARARAAAAAEREARSRVAQAEVALAESRRTLRRTERLVEAGSLAERDLDAARTEEGTLAGALDAARHHARAAALEAQSLRAALMDADPASARGGIALRAPSAGRVLRIFEEHERAVPAGTPVVEIGDPGALEVVVDLLSEDAQRVRPGAPMLLRAGEEGDTLRAVVRVVEPVAFTKVSPLGVEEQRVNVVGDLTGPPGSLGHAFRVRASIVLWRGDDVLQAPASALFRRGEGWAVYVLDDGRLRQRAVRIGRRGARAVEIEDGVRAGESVVLHPGGELADDMRARAAGGGA